MKIYLWGILILALCLGVLNYRRFVPRHRALGSKSCKVDRKAMDIDTGKHVLRGQLLIPRTDKEKLPTVIVSHGLNSNGKNAIAMVGQSLAMSGFQVYCFDFWGGSLHSRSGGKMEDMTVMTEKADLHAVIDHILSLPTTDPTALFLLGESQGGLVTALTAAERPGDIRALVEYYPALCIPDDARRRHPDPDRIPPKEHLGPSLLGAAYTASVYDLDPFDVISLYQGPVLILHGDQDRIVDISYGKRAAETYAHAEFVCLPGEIHGFTAPGKEKAALLSYEFLTRVMENDGRTEILTIHALLGKASMRHEGLYNIMTIPFTGQADSRYFRGTIQPGAADVQKRRLHLPVRFVADYTLKGTDLEGQACTIHIVNVFEGGKWQPTIRTDSQALSFLQSASLRAVLQGHKDQLTVRIFAKTD